MQNTELELSLKAWAVLAASAQADLQSAQASLQAAIGKAERAFRRVDSLKQEGSRIYGELEYRSWLAEIEMASWQ